MVTHEANSNRSVLHKHFSSSQEMVDVWGLNPNGREEILAFLIAWWQMNGIQRLSGDGKC